MPRFIKLIGILLLLLLFTGCVPSTLYKKNEAQPVLSEKDLLIKEANQGNIEALIKVGLFYYSGENGFREDQLEGARYLKKAAETGDANAQYLLACIYFSDESNSYVKSEKLALEWFKKSAGQGHIEAQNILNKLSENKTKIITLANQGNTDAQAELGIMYINGVYIEKDDKKGVYWLEKAAYQNNFKGQFLLGSHYFSNCYSEAMMTGKTNNSMNSQYAYAWLSIAYNNNASTQEARDMINLWLLALSTDMYYEQLQDAQKLIKQISNKIKK